MKKFTAFESRLVALAGDRQIDFPVDSFAKQCMLEGVDELGYILMQEPAIAAFEAKRAGSINTLS